MADPTPQIFTTWYLDKALYVSVLGMVLPFLGEKVGVHFSVEKCATLALLAVTFVISHKWKTATLVAKQLELQALAVAKAAVTE